MVDESTNINNHNELSPSVHNAVPASIWEVWEMFLCMFELERIDRVNIFGYE